MGNRKYNIDDTRKISDVVNVPTSGNSIIYPKIDDNWYIMGSDGIEFRLSRDIDFGDGFTITSGFEPYGSKVDVSIGLGLQFDIDGKIEVNVDEFTSIIETDPIFMSSEASNFVSGDKISYDNHISDMNNPHNLDKTQLGLGNVDNTSDVDKPISATTQIALDSKQNLLSSFDESILIENDGNIEGNVSLFEEYFEQQECELNFTPIQIIGVYLNGIKQKQSLYTIIPPKTISVTNFVTNDYIEIQYTKFKI